MLGQQAAFAAVGRTSPTRAEKANTQSCAKLPPFLAADGLKPYFSQGIQGASTSLIGYQTQAVFAAIGREGQVDKAQKSNDDTSSLQLPPFLDSENLKPYILQQKLPPSTSAIEYQTLAGRTAYGYEAGMAVSGTARRGQRPIVDACVRLVPALVGVAEIARWDGGMGGCPRVEPGFSHEAAAGVRNPASTLASMRRSRL